ncbi:kinase-like protein [Paxillus ammoniavirescens]|nr:kinase-like protein [Paxillus ammoniavirescens]
MTANCQTQPHRPPNVILFHHLFTAEVFHPLKRTTRIAPTCRPPSTTDSSGLTHTYENRWVVHDSHLRTQVLNGFKNIVSLPPAVLPERVFALPASSRLDMVEIGAKNERHTPAQMKQPRDTVNFTEGVILVQQIPAYVTQEGNLVASRLRSSPDHYVIADGSSGVPSHVSFQPSSIRSTVTASVTQKHFGDIPDLTEYLQRLHIDPVAAGGYGYVYKCSLRHGNDHSSEVAVKSFKHALAQNNTGVPQREFSKTLRREIKVWHGLRHSNIVPLLGIAFGFGSAISTVSPWISGGPLHTYLDTRAADLNLFDRFNLLQDVATGLRYLHSFPVVHGDLTSGNVLIDGDGKACLSDFGLCAVLGGLNGSSSFALTTCRPGAIEWAAPELVLTPDSVQPGPASDIFSFGCIMLQILSGQPPWGKTNRNTIILSLNKGDRAPRPAHRAIRDRDWDFIRRCWSSADVRPSIEDVMDYISPVLDSFRGDPHFVTDAFLQPHERPATRKRTYSEAVLDSGSASRLGARSDHPHWQVDDSDDSCPPKHPRFALS